MHIRLAYPEAEASYYWSDNTSSLNYPIPYNKKHISHPHNKHYFSTLIIICHRWEPGNRGEKAIISATSNRAFFHANSKATSPWGHIISKDYEFGQCLWNLCFFHIVRYFPIMYTSKWSKHSNFIKIQKNKMNPFTINGWSCHKQGGGMYLDD